MSQDSARSLRKWLARGETFVLPEVWDVASARVMVDAGFKAVGTSAASIAWAQGYLPHEHIKLEELLTIAARIARGSSVPVNADINGGLAGDPAKVRKAVLAACAAGCAGVTFGDGYRNGSQGILPAGQVVACIEAAREASAASGTRIAITVRTDVYLLAPEGGSPFEAALERSYRYFEAGADCLLVTGVQHPRVLSQLVAAADGPVAVALASPTPPPLSDFIEAGVACVTLGSSLMRGVLGNLRHRSQDLAAFGDFSGLQKGVISPEEMEELLAARPGGDRTAETA
ncbi:MAG: isocitrate lyase/phosphoenolpyruvate mutase family protein [Hyphomicrobiales bacterium]